ncbi:hypothetical protein B0H21DRAFT_797218, partial [Amylocystis lapponica]
MAVFDESEPSSVDSNPNSVRASSGKIVRHILLVAVLEVTLLWNAKRGRFCTSKTRGGSISMGFRRKASCFRNSTRNTSEMYRPCAVIATSAWRYWRGSRESNPVRKRTHHCLVEREVSRPLKVFDNGAVFLKVILDCLLAHSDAYNIARILHHDVSSGNILIVHQVVKGRQKAFGLLNDWELSKPLFDAPDDDPQTLGTWQFMSAFSLNDPCKSIILQDDLESFFHIVLYYVIRLFPSNCTNVDAFVADFFDAHKSNNDVEACGPEKNNAMESGKINVLVGGESVNLHFYRMPPSLPCEDRRAACSQSP